MRDARDSGDPGPGPKDAREAGRVGRGGHSRFDLTSDPGALDWRAITLGLQVAAEGLDDGVHALLALGLAHPELRFDSRLDEALMAAREARELAARLRASAVVQGEV